MFAVAVLANRSISVREAWLLFGLFISQFVLGGVLPDGLRELERIGVGIVYLVLAAWILVQQRALPAAAGARRARRTRSTSCSTKRRPDEARS